MKGPIIPIRQALGPLLCILLFSGCAYFNTFYNAQQYYKAAEKIRLEKFGQSLPSSGINAYMNAIKKSAIVLEKYPESRFRKPAIILMAKSRFHIGEYNQSQQLFFQIRDEYPEEKSETEYWLSLCKWKKGKLQPALTELRGQLDETNDDRLKARIYFSLADIHLETKQNIEAMDYLVLGAEHMDDPNERAEIYFRIADLAIASEDYDMAIEASKNVIRNSLTPKRVEDANLKLVKIYRMKEDWEDVSDLIKKLLADDSFRSIWGNLELELAKLDLANGNQESAMSRLKGVTADYTRTETSAEAYFILGETALFTHYNFEEALKSYKQVPKEFGKTPFKNKSQVREREINSFLATLRTIAAARESAALPDSADTDSLKTTNEDPFNNSAYPSSLYNAGELWAFHFENADSALPYFHEIADSLETSEWTPKAMYTLVFLLKDAGKDAEADAYKESLLSDYSKTEYAEGIRKSFGIEQEADPNHLQLLTAESLMTYDAKKAMNTYRTITESDSTEEFGLKAAYALAHYYDISAVEPDSAIKYYQWMETRFPNSESFLQISQRYQTMVRLVASMNQDTVKTDDRD